MAKRDYGRQAVYRAENQALPWGVLVLTPEEILAETRRIHELHGDGKSLPEIVFTHRQGGGGAAYNFQRKICLGRSVNSIFLLLHELAHIYTPVDVGHGPAWRRCYLKLICAVMGAADAKALSDAFAKNGVPETAAASTPVRRKETRPRRKFDLYFSVGEARKTNNWTAYYYPELVLAPKELRKQVPASDVALLYRGAYLYRYLTVSEKLVSVQLHMKIRKESS